MRVEDFQVLTLDSIDTVRKYVNSYVNGCCDNTVGCLFGWREFYGVYYCISEDILFIRYSNDEEIGVVYASPMPLSGRPEDFLKGIDMLMDMTVSSGENKLMLVTVTSPEIPYICEKYGSSVSYYADEDAYDYVYNSGDLAFFKGKKYHGERNHVNKFKSLYPDYTFVKITDERIKQAYDFCLEYVAKNPKTADTAVAEYKKIPEFFDNYTLYDFDGGALMVEGKIIGVCLGETIGDTLYEHFEKCDSSFAGAHQVLVSEMAKNFALDKGIPCINREDDAGDLNLRKSKLSYHPVYMIEKHVVTINCAD